MSAIASQMPADSLGTTQTKCPWLEQIIDPLSWDEMSIVGGKTQKGLSHC